MKGEKILIFLILGLAFVLRFWKLDEYPALNADEAAIGYNAYSLIQTGKDEHGNPWPIHFQSFNDYKPGLYFYLSLPLVKFFGLSAWSVRIPGVVLGVASVYLIYLLVNELFVKQKIPQPTTYNLQLGLVASLFLAISPWHIHFSRGGWEVNVATFLITLGLYLFLKAIRKSSVVYFVFCFLSFSLSLYTYHAARVVVPLLGIVLLIIYRDFLKNNFRNFVLACLVGMVALLPLVRDFTRSEIFSRAAGVGLIADPGPLSRINEQRGEHKDYTSIQAKVLHNKLVNYGLAFMKNWAEHFHGEFLFLSGDSIQRNKVPETGEMYLFDIIFITVGVLETIRILSKVKGANVFHPKGVKVVLWWILIAPIPAALTFQSPNALRSQNMVIPLVVISALGLNGVINWGKELFKKKYVFTTYLLLFTTIILWGFVRYLHMYWAHMAKEYPFSSQYGVKELVEYIKGSGESYKKIIVTDRYDQPYILFLFYLKYPPEKFQKEHELTAKDEYGFSTVRNFDKFEFRNISWDVDQPANPNSLIVGTDEEVPDEANIIKEIYGTNGYKYFQVVAN